MKKCGVKPPKIKSPYLSVEETAIYLRVSDRALENFRTAGGGPPYRKHGGRVVYHHEDLDAWSKARAYAHTGGAAAE
jgi:helix-turn-helix protein